MPYHYPDERNVVERLLDADYVFEVSRYPDAPLHSEDRLLYADPNSGRVLIARAPLSESRIDLTVRSRTDPRYRT
jgi:hypothetical protein